MNATKINLPSGEEIFCREWTPEKPNGEVVLLLHGVESHSEWFSDTAEELIRAGFAVFSYDRPGWGRSEGIKGHLESYADALTQLEELAVSLRVKHSKIHLAGLSWGGLFALYTSLRRSIYFDSLTLIAPGIFQKSPLPLLDKLQVASGILLNNPQKMVSIPINTEHFTKRADKTAFIKDDKYRTKEVSASFCFETLKMRKFCQEFTAKRQLIPTTLLLAQNDEIIDNQQTGQLFCNKDEVRMIQIPDTEHSLIFEATAKVAEEIIRNAAKSRQTGKRVAIMGAGAVGSAVGGLLALGGNDVTLIARKKHVENINNNGLILELGSGSRTITKNLQAVENAADAGSNLDLVIISVKSFDTKNALKDIKPMIGKNTVILSLQNGISNEDKIREAYPKNTVLGGAICAYLNFVEAGRICWTDDRGGLAVGLHSGDEAAAREAVEILQTTGMEVVYCSESKRVKWSKLMLNTAFNAINAATGMPTAEILADEKYGTLAVTALREGFKVMQAQHIEPINLPGYEVGKLGKLCKAPIFIARKILAKITAKEKKTVSSMAQDVQKGRGLTEIAEINGAIVDYAKIYAIATPANNELCQMLVDK